MYKVRITVTIYSGSSPAPLAEATGDIVMHNLYAESQAFENVEEVGKLACTLLRHAEEDR